MEYVLNEMMIQKFQEKLLEDEKTDATIKKYIHDIRIFFTYIGSEGIVSKAIMIAYKEYLVHHYAAVSVNSMLAAVNVFMKDLGWYDCVVKALKIQKEAFRAGDRELSKDEYYRLLNAAKKKGNIRLYMIMQTLCATGIRISELKFITVESLNKQCARVCSKGKQRLVLLPEVLCHKLKKYVRERKIKSGSIFVTRTGEAVDRSNVCHEMKALCEETGIPREKVFPHNLRHLFATTYYNMKKDLSHLADLLGHSSINTTRIYTLVSSEEQARQIEFLGFVV